jgi:hypothetical protein
MILRMLIRTRRLHLLRSRASKTLFHQATGHLLPEIGRVHVGATALARIRLCSNAQLAGHFPPRLEGGVKRFLLLDTLPRPDRSHALVYAVDLFN